MKYTTPEIWRSVNVRDKNAREAAFQNWDSAFKRYFDYLEEIKEHINNIHPSELILDFSKINYVASIGLRAILELHKTMIHRRGQLVLKNVNQEINPIILNKVTNLDEKTTTENFSLSFQYVVDFGNYVLEKLRELEISDERVIEKYINSTF